MSDIYTNASYPDIAQAVRRDIIDMIYEAGMGHPGSSLSCVEMVVALYFGGIIRVDPANPDAPDRDRFVLSKGHSMEAYYAVLCKKGFLDLEDVKARFSKFGSPYIGHPNNKLPGIEMNSGSLGHGLPVCVGMALAGKVKGENYRVYSILGDGEIAEGQVWEAFMSAAKYKLDNLCACIDVNGLQIDGRTADVMPSEPLDKKLEAFGWHVIKIDGHDYDAIEAAYAEAAATKGQPTMILAKTTKGKGVSFMEDHAGWHGKAPNDEQMAVAKAELEAAIKELEG